MTLTEPIRGDFEKGPWTCLDVAGLTSGWA
jgi:hypothetical protein